METRHLGFNINLAQKMLMVTQKHRRKIISFFDGFLVAVRKKQRIKVRTIQRMLGLQV